jgi:hypothetical protein
MSRRANDPGTNARMRRAPSAPDPRLDLIHDIAGFTHDPLGHALYAYPWGEGALAGADGPRGWQREALTQVGEHLANPTTRHHPCRIARASGHGIGKSAAIAMFAKWGLDTCEDARILLTANTEAQILTKTMPEIAKWHHLSISRDWFAPTATALISTASGHEKSWRADAVTWSQTNTEAFAGLHNKGKRILILFDESSGIVDKVWEVTQGALTDEETEIVWIAFGNPTLNSGRFRECFGRERHLWNHAQIDSRTVEGTNKYYLDEMVAAYGLDSDLVKVRVLGQFPSASSLQFIPTATVRAARTREVGQLYSDPLIFGVDCARFGDDHSTLAIRCGRDARSRPWRRWRHTDAMSLAGDIALEAKTWRPDAIFVDAGNIGAAVVDRLRQLGCENVIEVWFGGKGRDAEWAVGVRVRTVNKRSEIWASMRGWLAGGAIPDEQAIEDDLTGVEYGFAADQAIALEKKDHMKARGLASPDDADALACTFAEPVMPREAPEHAAPWREAEEYDRYRELER